MRTWVPISAAVVVGVLIFIVGVAYGVDWLNAREEAREYAGGIEVGTAREEAVAALANQRKDALELMPVRYFRGYALGRETWVFMYGKASASEEVCVYVWSPNNGYDLRSIVGECKHMRNRERWGYAMLTAGVLLVTASLVSVSGWLGYTLAAVNFVCVVNALIYISVVRRRGR